MSNRAFGPEARAEALANAQRVASSAEDPLPWYEHGLEILEAEATLLRAGVLNADDAGPGKYFRQRPEKWDRELRTCRTLERIMMQHGVLPTEGWDMTLRELADASVARERTLVSAPGPAHDCPMAIRCIRGLTLCAHCQSKVKK